jgi:hypothetical protein
MIINVSVTLFVLLVCFSIEESGNFLLQIKTATECPKMRTFSTDILMQGLTVGASSAITVHYCSLDGK